MTRTEFEGDESGRCGGCGSRNLICYQGEDGTKYGACIECQRFQEVEHRDWPLSVMCDNCAFRVNSPERSDPYRWAEIMETLETEQPFHCHKGLNAKLDAESCNVSFDAPNPENDRRVTVCAGWFAALTAKYRRTEKEAASK